jgi:hypothetical protein
VNCKGCRNRRAAVGEFEVMYGNLMGEAEKNYEETIKN